MTGERDPFARSGWLVAVVVAVPLLGVADAVGPRPFAALGFAANLTVLGVAGGRALLGRAGLSAVERATVALALPIGVLVLGTIAAAALRLHLDRPLWAALVALAAEAAAVGVLSRRGHPSEPRNPRGWRTVRPQDGSGDLVGRVADGGGSRAGHRGRSVRVDGGPARPIPPSARCPRSVWAAPSVRCGSS